MQTTRGATPLMYACQQCMEKEVSDILSKQPYTVRDRDRTLKTPLHYCAENASVICAEAILKIAPELVNAKDENGYCPLHLAVIAGNKPLIKLLISKGTNVNTRDNEGHSAVHWAIVSSEKEALEIIIRSGANASTPDVHGGYPLHYAVQMCGSNGDSARNPTDAIKVVQTLLHFGVDVNVKDKDGRQPILWAASAGSADAIVHLVNGGASVEAADKDGLTALHCAASRGHTDTLETLITLCGANVDVIDGNGCSALFYSVTLGHADCTELLLQLGAEPNRQDRKGRTPAHCGAAKGQLETLRILQKHGGNLWVKNIKGDLPLHEAIASGRKDLVLWLLSQNPEAVNIPNKDGRCPIHIAAMYNNTEMIKVLLDSKSLINPVMRTSKGILMTPLNVALSKGHRSCGKFLQLHGGVPFSKVLKTEPNFLYAVRVSPSEDMMKTGETNVALLSPSSRISRTNFSQDNQVTIKVDSGDKKKVYRRRKKRSKTNDRKDSDSDESDDETYKRTQGIRKSSDNDGVSDKKTIRDENGNVHIKARNITFKTESSSTNENARKRSAPERKDETVEENVSVKKVTKTRTESKPLQRSLSEYKNVSDLSPEDFPPLMQNVNHLDDEIMETEMDEGKQTNENENVENELVSSQQNVQNAGGTEDVERTSQNLEKGIKTDQDLLQTTDITKESSSHLSLSSRKESSVGDDKAGSSNETDGKAKDGDKEDAKVVNWEEPEGKAGKGVGAKRSSGGSSGSQKNGKPSKIGGKKSSRSTGSIPSDEKSLKSSSDGVSNRKTEKTTTRGSRTSASSHSSDNPTEKVKEVTVTEVVSSEAPIEKEVTIPLQGSESGDVVPVEGNKTSEEVTESKDEKVEKADETKDPNTQIPDTKDENLNDSSAATTSNDNLLIEAENSTKALETENNPADEIKEQKESEQAAVSTLSTDETQVHNIEERTSAPDADVGTLHPIDDASHETSKPKDSSSIALVPVEEKSLNGSSVEISNSTDFVEKPPENLSLDKNNQELNTRTTSGKDEERDEVTGRPPDSSTIEENDLRRAVADIEDLNQTIFDEAIDERSQTQGENSNDEKSKTPNSAGEENDLERNGEENTFEKSVKPQPIEDVVSGGEHSGNRFSEKENNGCITIEQKHHKTPRVSRLCRMNRDTNEVTTTDISVTQLVQNTIRKYHMERGIFHQLLELKRLQIRAGRANEQVLVKRLVDEYERSRALHGMRHFTGVYKFREFEKFLYDQLKALNSRHQLIIPELKSYDDIDALSGILKKRRFRLISEMAPIDPTCTCITQRCHHTTHAYTSLPCSAYIADLRRQKSHKARKDCFLPRIEQMPSSFKTERQKANSHPPTLELIQGNEKQVITLPQNYPEKGKRYYVTFTIKSAPSFKEEDLFDDRKDFFKHRHAKSV